MLVSIIIPCYNVSKYVGDTIRSALAQEYQPIEIICVDNNSTDDTYNLIQHFAKNNPGRIKVFSCTNQGAPFARNLGLSRSQGEWIQFLDADDILKPRKIAAQVELVVQSTRPVQLVCGTYLIENGNQLIEVPPDNLGSWLNLFTNRLGITSANLWGKNTILGVGGWNTRKSSSQEYYLLFEMLKKGVDIIYDTLPNTIVRRRAQSISLGSEQSSLARNSFLLRFEIYQYLKNKLPNIAYQHEVLINTAFLKYLRNVCLHDPIKTTEYLSISPPIPKKLDLSPYLGRFYTSAYNWFGFRNSLLVYRWYLRLAVGINYLKRKFQILSFNSR